MILNRGIQTNAYEVVEFNRIFTMKKKDYEEIPNKKKKS